MALTLGIAGAGLMGRLLAEAATHAGWRVTLFDRDAADGTASCGHVGAGMLAPWCELEHAEPLITALGSRSLALWPATVARLAQPVFLQQEGSLVVAHPHDRAELERLAALVRRAAPDDEAMRPVAAEALRTLEPELADRFADGLYFPREGQIDNLGLMAALAATLRERGADWRAASAVVALRPHTLITADGGAHRFDWVADCRGLGAKPDLTTLRGVRGEVLRLHAPEVALHRPVRLMHPRYPLYVVPRPHGHYVVGATSLESEDMSPPSVRSLLELLSAAYTLHPAFAEARLVSATVNCRPAFPDHLPRLAWQPGLLRANGLYRHGFLLGPALTEAALAVLAAAPVPAVATAIVQETHP